MKNFAKNRTIPFLFFFALSTLSQAQTRVHHQIQVQLDPAAHHLEVDDQITLPAEWTNGDALRFTLHDGLNPKTSDSTIQLTAEDRVGDQDPLARYYHLTLPRGTQSFTLHYSGEIYHPLSTPGEEYDRGFQDTPGLIAAEGVFLSSATSWYPRFDSELVTFSIQTNLPVEWKAVSQGNRIENHWESPEPQTEIYLIAGKWTEYEQNANGLKALAFLRTPDPTLAQQYLDATLQYVKMYNGLIGNYPYQKFALVENFWETGFGMPSFTLLGPKIIRFPFIINSSYPHEILHNWWGNGVFVDYQGGNWCEGLTAYLADHLLKEQVQGGTEYRRSTLQKYTDFVSANNDFPLMDFKERFSSSTEAVGYGKALMFFHMLRTQFGDETFQKAVRALYTTHKFNRVSYDDIRKIFEGVTQTPLQPTFDQWVHRTGAPELAVSNAQARPVDAGYEITATLRQVQPDAAYELKIPVAIHLEGHSRAFQADITMNTHEEKVRFIVPARPLLFDVDPEFDVFRRLNHFEIPPALSQTFGASKVLVVVPSDAPLALKTAYEALAQSWSHSADAKEYEVKLDRELITLPSDRAVWILGFENRFASQIAGGLEEYNSAVTDTTLRVNDQVFPRLSHSFVASIRAPGHPDQTWSWVAGASPSAIAGLDHKLPHYGKYSFLVFKGDEPQNQAKGIWPTLHSPMSVGVLQSDGTLTSGPRAALKPRSALAPLAPEFSATSMKETVTYLTQDRLKGRELGTPELDEISVTLAEKFEKAGLTPAGNPGFFQIWNEQLPTPKGQALLKNIVGVIPGANPALTGQSLVISAHYDHLGLGWPIAHEGDAGKIHPGADDNASGVAILLEVARVFAQAAKNGLPPERTLVFVAFTGEESGLLGSKHFAQLGAAPFAPVSGFFSMINLDTVGRLGPNKLTVFGVGTAQEWNEILSTASMRTGLSMDPVMANIGASDQNRFWAIGVPALQFFSGAHADYHRPTDTIDKLDWKGMTQIAAATYEITRILSNRSAPLTATLSPAPGPSEPDHPRKVFLGTVPDFAFSGPGIKVNSVVAGSPADQAGLKSEDIIIQIDQVKIANLKTYSDFLKTLNPGDSIEIIFLREGDQHLTHATLSPLYQSQTASN
ncbi:M20/M25/M40 family metallo-hydrolase [Bdellovibrionota bacterium FG-1]